MPQFWPILEDLLEPALLTVEAQLLPLEDRGDELLWDTFFPREDVESVELNSVTTLDYRPVADRREWNARGRRLAQPTPARRRVSIIPIEANDRIDEKEMQHLMERAGGNGDRLRELIGPTIPKRIEKIVDAVYRRVEVDSFTAWTVGTITQKNPETGVTYVASFGFDAARLNTAGTAWNNGGVNAYNLLQAWIVAAEDKVGPIKGCMLRRVSLDAILADAPNLENSVAMTRSSLEDRVSQDKGSEFRFVVNERTVDIFDDGGTATTRTKLWPAQKIAAIPTDNRIGRMAFAPVVRAMELNGANVGDEDGVDVRGVTVYAEASNGGRELSMEGQLNAIPVPEEGRVYVTDIGV